MSHHPDPHSQRLLQFNVDVLEQAVGLVAWFGQGGGPDYSTPVGAHLRHVIEHYEALLAPSDPGFVDYDQRPRDRELERQPVVALNRLKALQGLLRRTTDARLNAPLQVRGLGGLAGEFGFAVTSSIGRELVFVATHAIHHYALLKTHGERHGIPLDPGFGRAPATVAHERTANPARPPNPSRETSCPA